MEKHEKKEPISLEYHSLQSRDISSKDANLDICNQRRFQGVLQQNEQNCKKAFWLNWKRILMPFQEHCDIWEKESGIRVSIMTMSRAIDSSGWTRKKNVRSEREKRRRANVMERKREKA